MNQRTQQILEVVIREFIETGQPVSSGCLYKKHDFNVKPATIRNELNFLDQEQFLEQLHTSGGRVPTSKGYQFLVERIMSGLMAEIQLEAFKAFSVLVNELRQKDFEDFVDDVSDELEVLSVGYAPPGREIYKSGLDNLFKNLINDFSFNNVRDTYQIIEDFEMIDERIGQLADFIPKAGEPIVFIGKSPITKSGRLSVIADRYHANGEDFVLALIGPKRMDYERNIGFLKKMKEKLVTS